MGRREISIGVWLALLGVGGTAFASGLVAPDTAFATYLVLGGALVTTVAGIGVWRMYRSAPEVTVPEVTARPLAVLEPPASTPGREFLGPEITPKVLRDKIKGRTSVQIESVSRTYTGKWMKVQGSVNDVKSVYDGLWILFLNEVGGDGKISITFSKKWFDQLSALRVGDGVVAVGKVSHLNEGALLSDGEIIHIDGPLPTK